MNRRGKRFALGVAAVGLSVVIILAIVHWGTVRDHIEGWRFQLGRETKTILPGSAWEEPPLGFMIVVEGDSRWHFDLAGCLLVLSTYSDLPVIVDSVMYEQIASAATREDPPSWIVPAGYALTEEGARGVLEENGYRVLEQRFPRRACVVILDEHARDEAIRDFFESSAGLLPRG